MILICFWREFNPEFGCSWSPFKEAAVMNVDDSTYFEFKIVENVILDGRKVTATKTWTKYAFLTIIAFYGVKHLIAFSPHLDERICTSIIDASQEPAPYPQRAQGTTACVRNYHLVLKAGNVLQAASGWERMYLQCRVAVATSCPNSFSFASKGRLHTQTALDRQSDVYLI